MNFFDVHKQDGLMLIWLDQPESRVNTLTQASLRDFGALLDDLQQDAELKAAILLSRKRDSFIVGADIKEFAEFSTQDEVLKLIHEGHALLRRLESSTKPVLAAIHGACVGGGLELVMACHYRLASSHPKTVLALPEVNLGLLPGLGGTQRLPRLVGLQTGLEMILTGKNLYAKPALKAGLVDALIHPAGLVEAAKQAAYGLVSGSLKRRERKVKLRDSLLEKTPLNRVVYSKAAESVQQKTRGNYPAATRIIEVVRTGLTKGRADGLEAEAKAFAELVFTPQSKALRHLFFSKLACERNPLKEQVKQVTTVGVLGAGLMGSGIAQVSAQRGLEVLLKDIKLDYAARGKAAIHRDVSKRVGKGMTAFERDQLMSRLTITESYGGFDGVQLTIEAVLETLEMKQEVLREVEAVAPEGHVFASNTSSIPIQQIAAASRHPQAVLGMHYFSPVPKMPLLEIIRTEQTADWALATAIEVGLRQGKTIIVVGDKPGFYANRILAPYMNEALLLLKEGAAVDTIDQAMRDFGFPVGPLKLIDEVGMDVGAHVTSVMAPLFAERGIELVQLQMDAPGLKGRKSGKGFYLYESGKSKGVNQGIYQYFGGGERRTISKTEIQERLFLAMVNEAVYTLQEGVIQSTRDGDVGAVFGIGFPPFLGGPFFYLNQQGSTQVLSRIEALVSRHGARYTPAALLEQVAKDDGVFK